jgi:hypothetical protein
VLSPPSEGVLNVLPPVTTPADLDRTPRPADTPRKTKKQKPPPEPVPGPRGRGTWFVLIGVLAAFLALVAAVATLVR